MRAPHGSAADVERGCDHAVRTKPVHAVHHADDVDDGVERPDFVKVDLVDRHAVDRGLGLAKPIEQMNRPILALSRQRGAFDESRDGLQAVMRPMMMAVIVVVVIVMMVMFLAVTMTVTAGRHLGDRRFLEPELRRRHAGAQHTVGRHGAVLERQTAERRAQTIDRQTQIEQRPEEHVARSAGETVDVSNPWHDYPLSHK